MGDHKPGGALVLAAELVTQHAPEAPNLSSAVLPILPEEFWAARRVLQHIRSAAHARLAPADLVLHATMAKVSAMRSPDLWFDSGRGRSSLNYFVAGVGPSGIGKTTGTAVVDNDLLPVPAYLSKPTDEDADAVPFHDGIPLGSGEGIAEAFMGWREVEVGEKKDGSSVMKRVRAQVRHNVLIVVDEGQAFTRLGERTGATTTTTVRSAWVGATIGSTNAREETTRIIRAGTYSLGMIAGFQPATALPLLADTATGTAQRFAWASAVDPTIPDEHVEHPGPLEFVALAETEFSSSPRTGAIAFPKEIVADLRRAHLAKVRGQVVVAESDSQGPLMRCKQAALLALLDNRAEVTDDDWELAGLMWDTQSAFRDAVIDAGRREKARDEEVKAQLRVQLAERTAGAVGQVDAKLARLAETLAARVVTEGGLRRGDARRGMRSDERHLFDSVVEKAEGLGLLRRTPDDGALLPPPLAVRA